jgi:hypothetical protein
MIQRIQAMLPTPIAQFGWGVLGAAAAAWFAVWMLFFPESIPTLFAWDVQPRLAQVFIGGGYIFRTVFFLSVAFERDWTRLRWMFWGNLVFTGTLLLASYWHIDEFNWPPSQTLLAHLWLILYIFEPVTMLHMVPRGLASIPSPDTGGPIHRLFKTFLILTTGLLLTNGLVLVINPEFAATRWPWELNPLDARIIAAWFLGWSAWCATMAFGRDWDEIRLPAALFVVNGVALSASFLFFGDQFRALTTTDSYEKGIVGLTILMAAFFVYQEYRRRTPRPDSRAPSTSA